MSVLGRGGGVRVVDLGAFPGSGEGTFSVTGQTGLLSTALTRAWVTPVATDDHTADEHTLEVLNVTAGAATADDGFTLRVASTQPGQFGKWSIAFEWVNQ